MWDGIDKRRFPRVRYSCSIYIRRKDSTQTISTMTENVGGGGICVILNEDIGLFKGVDIEIRLADGKEAIKSKGTVVWVVKKQEIGHRDKIEYDTGIEFMDIKPTDRARVMKAVENILRQKKP